MRLPSDGVLPGSIRQEQNSRVKDHEQEPMKLIALALIHLRNEISKLPRMVEDFSRPVDEYQVQSLAPESELTLTIQPQWEVSEKITSIVITGPPTQISYQNTQTPLSSIVLGASGAAAYNNNPFPVAVFVSGGTVSAISVNGVSTGIAATNLNVYVPAFGTIAITYTVAPTIFTNGYSAQVTVPNTGALQLGDRLWNFSMPPSGVLVIAPVSVLLGRSDPRVLTVASAGEYTVELMGYCDTRNQMV